MRQKLVILLEHFNWVILVALLALSIGLGLANNLRVDDEKRVNWLGGSVSSSDVGDAIVGKINTDIEALPIVKG